MGNIYYVAGIPYSAELYHHGIKGQKWGIRRYQNEDGTLTPAGKERYGELGSHTNSKNVLRRTLTGDHVLGMQRLRAKREDNLKKLVENDEAKGHNSALSKAAYEAQKQKNIDIDRYISHTSTGKLFAQQLVFGGFGADAYRASRARGATRGEAFVEQLLDKIVVYGTMGFSTSSGIRDEKERRKYGAQAL